MKNSQAMESLVSATALRWLLEPHSAWVKYWESNMTDMGTLSTADTLPTWAPPSNQQLFEMGISTNNLASFSKTLSDVLSAPFSDMASTAEITSSDVQNNTWATNPQDPWNLWEKGRNKFLTNAHYHFLQTEKT